MISFIHKKYLRFAIVAGFIGLILTPAMADEAQANSPADLEAGFVTPPQDDRPRVWWDWMNGSLTKEGIKADLEDMKTMGIGGFHVRQVDPKFPKGPIIYGTDAWYDYFHYAMQTSADLGLQFGMNNSPGWSGSGGPWVKVEDSMKKVTWSTVDVEGHVHRVLPDPLRNFDFYRDTSVMAIPADPQPDNAVPTLTSNISGLNLNLLIDGKVTEDSAVTIPKKQDSFVVTYTYPQTVDRRLFTIIALFERGAKVTLNGTIEASEDGSTFRKVRSFSYPGQLQAHKGFQGENIVLSVPFEPLQAKVFRVSFKGGVSPSMLAELNFSRRLSSRKLQHQDPRQPARRPAPRCPSSARTRRPSRRTRYSTSPPR